MIKNPHAIHFAELKELHEKGLLDDEEYRTERGKLVNLFSDAFKEAFLKERDKQLRDIEREEELNIRDHTLEIQRRHQQYVLDMVEEKTRRIKAIDEAGLDENTHEWARKNIMDQRLPPLQLPPMMGSADETGQQLLESGLAGGENKKLLLLEGPQQEAEQQRNEQPRARFEPHARFEPRLLTQYQPEPLIPTEPEPHAGPTIPESRSSEYPAPTSSNFNMEPVDARQSFYSETESDFGASSLASLPGERDEKPDVLEIGARLLVKNQSGPFTDWIGGFVTGFATPDKPFVTPDRWGGKYTWDEWCFPELPVIQLINVSCALRSLCYLNRSRAPGSKFGINHPKTG